MASNIAINSSLTSTNNNLKAVNNAVINLGRTMTMFVSAPLGIVAAASTKTFANFEYSLAKITGLVGIASEQTKEWGDEVLRMGPKIGKAPQELADALYFITSSGFKTSESMKILNVSAKAAASGLGETKNVADIVTSAMNAYERGTLSATKAVDVLTMAVREGKGEPEELVKAFATSIPIAAKLGVEFDEVGGAIASMTRLGIGASTASTYLRQSLFTLLKPSSKTVKGLQAIGLSANEVRDSLRNNGLIDTFTMLSEKTKNLNQEALSNIFPNIRAFMALVSLVNENLGETKNVFDTVTNSTGVTNAAFAAVSETLKFKWNKAMSQGQVLLIKIGESVGRSLLPLLEKLTEIFKDLGNYWDGLGSGLQNTIIKFAGLAIVMGPAILLWKGMKSVLSGINIVFDVISGKLFKLTSAIKTFTVYSKQASQTVQTVTQNAGSSLAGGAVAAGGAKRRYVTKEEDAASFSMAARAAAYKKQTDVEIQKAKDAAKAAKATAKQQIAAGEAVKKVRESTVMGTKIAAYETKKLTDLTVAATLAQQTASKTDAKVAAETLKLAKYKAYLNKAQELTIKAEDKAIATRGLSNNLYSRAAKLKAQLAQEELAYAAAKSKSNLTDALGLRSSTSLTGAYTVQGRVMGPQAKMYELRKKLKMANAAATSIEIAAMEAEKKAQEGRIFVSELENKIGKQNTVVKELSARASKKHQVALLLESEAAKRKTAIEIAEQRAVEARTAAYVRAAAANKIYMASTGATYKSIRSAHVADIALRAKQAKQVRDNAKAAQEAAKAAANTTNNVNKARASWGAFFASLGRIPWLVVVAGLGAIAYGIYHLIKKSKELTGTFKIQKEVSESVADSYSEEKSKVESLLLVAGNELASRKMRLDAIAKLNEISPEYLGNINLENISLQSTTKSVEEYNKSLLAQIQNQVYSDKLQVLMAEHTKLLMNNKLGEISTMKKVVTVWKELGVIQQGIVRLASFAVSPIAGLFTLDLLGKTKKGQEALTKAQQEQAEKAQANYEVQVAYFLNSMNKKQYAVNDLIAGYNNLKDVVNSVAKEDEKVTAMEKSAKTKEQISAAAKARKEQQEHAKNALIRMNTETNKAKELLGYSQKMIDNDELLKTYADQKLSTNEEIRKNAEIQWQERFNYLLKEGKELDKSKPRIKSIYDAYENGYDRLRKMYKGKDLPWEDEEDITTPDAFSTGVLSALDELKNKLNEAFTTYQSKLSLVDSVSAILGENVDASTQKAKIMADVLTTVAEAQENGIDIDIKKAAAANILYKVFNQITAVYEELGKWTEQYNKEMEDAVDSTIYYGNTFKRLGEIDSYVSDSIKDLANTVKYSGGEFTLAEAKIEVYANAIKDLRDNYDKLRKDKKITVSNDILNVILSDILKNKKLLKEAKLEKAFEDYRRSLELVRMEATIAGGSFATFGETVSLLERTFQALWDEGQRSGVFFDTVLSGLSELRQIENVKNTFSEIGSAFGELTSILGLGEETWVEYVETILNNIPKIIEMIMSLTAASTLENLASQSFINSVNNENNAISTETLTITANTAAIEANTAAKIANGMISAVGDNGGTGGGTGNGGGGNGAAGALGGVAKFAGQFSAVLGGILGIVSIVSLLFKKKKKQTQTYTKLAEGGIVPPGYPNDSYPARLSSGEMVVPPMKLPEFEKQTVDVHVTVEGKTRGQDLYYVIKEVERRYKNAY